MIFIILIETFWCHHYSTTSHPNSGFNDDHPGNCRLESGVLNPGCSGKCNCRVL